MGLTKFYSIYLVDEASLVLILGFNMIYACTNQIIFQNVLYLDYWWSCKAVL